MMQSFDSKPPYLRHKGCKTDPVNVAFASPGPMSLVEDCFPCIDLVLVCCLAFFGDFTFVFRFFLHEAVKKNRDCEVPASFSFAFLPASVGIRSSSNSIS